jgi:hypothetical protein
LFNVDQSPVLHQRLHRHAQRFGVAAHRLLDQRQVVEHGGGIARVGARRRLLQRLLEPAPGVGIPSHPQATRTQDPEAQQPRVMVTRAT